MMMREQPFVDGATTSLSERLLDEALVEAAVSSPEFARALAAFVGVKTDEGQSALSAVAERSVMHGTGAAAGETDVLLRFHVDKGAFLSLLIENKVTAGFQPRQGQRYRDRATEIQGADGYAATTVLLAPARYLAAPAPEARFFVHHLSLEIAASWFTEEQRTRLRAAALFRALIARAADGRPLGAKGLFPELHFSLGAELTRRRTGIVITNRPTDWVFMDQSARLPAGGKLRYRIRDGIAELRFRGRDLNRATALGARVTPPLTVTTHDSEISFALPVAVSHQGLTGAPTASDIDSIASALEALLSWYGGRDIGDAPQAC